MVTNPSSRTIWMLGAALIALLLALTACGGAPAPAETQEAAAATEAPAATQAPAETEAPAAETEAPPETEEMMETEAPPAETEAPAAPDYEGPFPVPEDAQNFMQMETNMINFQTGLSLEEVMEFYRQELTAQGLTEREVLTVFEGSTFSMVFDGGPDGMSVVVQGVDLGGGSTNVNVRYEDV